MSQMLDAAVAVVHRPPCQGFHAERPPRNKGDRYPADPPTVEETLSVMRAARDSLHAQRLRGLIAVLVPAGLRISEALALAESDLDARRGAVLIRRGKGGRRRKVGMDEWAWQELQPWLELPVRPLFCIITGPTRGRRWSTAAARNEMRHAAAVAGVRRRFAPHQLRHANAVQMAREGCPAGRHPRTAWPQQPWYPVDLPARHHSAEIIDTVHARRTPMIPVRTTR